jgi:CheY-like chemotaxis protein
MESLGVLAGGIAHDFNNLLMGILGNVDLALVDLTSDRAVRESLQEIKSAADRAADLCRQMLAYSGKGRFVIQSLDLTQLVGEMTHLLGVSISKRVSLEYDCDANMPPVEGDATQIRQIIMNLVTNASDAIGEGTGEIHIRTGVRHCDQDKLRTMTLGEDLPAGEYVFIEVSDNGCGMDHRTRKRIFEPFYTTKFTGRGLGLAAVLGIVRGHQGALQVESELEQGAVFQVLFPVSEQTDEVYQAGRTSQLSLVGGGTILVVDDEDAVRALAARMLEKLGYEVLTAADGQQSIQIFQERHTEIDAVILDMTMPHMSGEDTLHALREIDPRIRVVLSSGYNEPEILMESAVGDQVDFIQKPYQMTALGAKLRQVLA